MNIFFYEVFEEEAAALKKYLGNSFSYEFTDKTIQESGHTVPPAAVISIRTQSIIPSRWEENLSGVLSRSRGYDHLVRYRSQIQKKIPCGFLEEYSARAVAEHAVLLMTALMRKLPKQMKQFSGFLRDGITGIESHGKSLLVVGAGRIGSEIISIANGLGMIVHAVDLKPVRSNIAYVSPEDGFRNADAVICAMNLNETNYSYFNKNSIDAIRPGAVFINIARGEMSQFTDLIYGIESGRLGGIGLDVFDHEGELAAAMRSSSGAPSVFLHQLRQLLNYDNVICTPHNAFNTIEAVDRKSSMTAAQLQHFFSHGKFIWQTE